MRLWSESPAISESFAKLLAPLQHALDRRIGLKADAFGHLDLGRHLAKAVLEDELIAGELNELIPIELLVAVAIVLVEDRKGLVLGDDVHAIAEGLGALEEGADLIHVEKPAPARVRLVELGFQSEVVLDALLAVIEELYPNGELQENKFQK